MSRSYKKNAYNGEPSLKENKKIANRKLRREKIDYYEDDYESPQNYKSYKKKNQIKENNQNTFDMDFEEFKKKRLGWWENHHKENENPPTDKDLEREYHVLYRNK